MKKVCVIPARLASKRFPRKILAPIGDRTLLQWTWEAAMETEAFDRVIIALDADETAEVVDGFGGEWMMTSMECQSGTDRLIEVSKEVRSDIWVNWQADEPFISREMIGDLLQSCHDGSDVWTLKKYLDDPSSPHKVKVVTNEDGRALYFSRSPIPYAGPYYLHLGIYAYTSDALLSISHMKPTENEKSESLEQLRFLGNGLSIRVHETEGQSLGVDTAEDLERAIALTRAHH